MPSKTQLWEQWEIMLKYENVISFDIKAVRERSLSGVVEHDEPVLWISEKTLLILCLILTFLNCSSLTFQTMIEISKRHRKKTKALSPMKN